MTDTTRELDAALDALTDASVALITLHPIIRVTNSEANGFVEEGIKAVSMARQHLLALREKHANRVSQNEDKRKKPLTTDTYSN
ncbi:MAG: hypothetical protein KatS3mg015_2473 [Fimbriimonadales bacterium]|nr:MAG: hypothetical protein KatS3mg015_2473 [Fimbriimonadales bacterium]